MAQSDGILQEIESLDAELVPILAQTDSAWKLAELLPTKYPPEIVAKPPCLGASRLVSSASGS